VLLFDTNIFGRIVVISKGSQNGSHTLELVEDTETVDVPGMKDQVYSLEYFEHLWGKLSLGPGNMCI